MIISRVGVPTSRLRSGWMQIPIWHYTRPSDNRSVILVGAIHIGDKQYYADMQHIVNTAQTKDFKILYEGVGKLDKEDLLSLPTHQQKIALQMKSISKTMIDFAELMDLVFQKKGLSYKKEWVNTDMSLTEVVNELTLREVDFGINSSKGSVNLFDLPKEEKSILKFFALFALKHIGGINTLRSIFKPTTRSENAREEVIIHMRDKIAADAIITHAKNTNVLSIWGAAHLPGIGMRLEIGGFKHTDTMWLNAIS